MEVAPGKFVTMVLRNATAVLDLRTDYENDPNFRHSMDRVYYTRTARIELEGTLTNQFEDDRPPAWAEEPMKEIDGRKTLPAGKEEIDLGSEGDWL
jgi:hypothetical protein